MAEKLFTEPDTVGTDKTVEEQLSQVKFHLQRHKDSVYESNSNILTETSSGKHNMIDGEAFYVSSLLMKLM